ncbi:MAG TPA: O-antigen ligase family protein [Nocardioidaceae bacterium]|nr:O-antigen ligase family protein [Nocardioidaceae bacterium]
MSAALVVAVVAAPFGIALAVACLRQPMRIALPVFAALIPFGERLSLGGSPYASLSSVVGMLLGVGLLLQLLLGRRSAPLLSPSVPIWLLFLATAVATTLWTIDLGATLSGLGVLGSLVLVYVLTVLSPADRQVLRRTENGLLAGGVAVVCYGLVQLFLFGGFPSGKTTGLPTTVTTGRFGNDLLGPDIESITLLLPLVIALHRAFTQRSGRALNGFVAALVLLGILMTGSRTGTLAAAAVVLVLAWAGPRTARNGILVTFVVAAVLGAVIWVFHPAGIAERTFSSAASSSGRTDIWKVGAAACTRYCGPGAGWGTFPDVYAATQATVPGARVLVGPQGSYQAHNLWLLVGVELGAAGLALFLAGLGVGFVEALRIPRALRGPPLSALVGLCIGVFFLSSMEFKFFWMVLILIGMTRNVVEGERRASEASVVGGEPHVTVRVPLAGG